MSEEAVAFFKALADATRLKIVGLLAQQPYSVEELAALLNLKASTVSHHLAKLAQVGLVSAKTESYYNVYQLDEKALQSKSRDLFSQENPLPPWMWMQMPMTIKWSRIMSAKMEA
jgi:DNA-binding transcriptional ArsR family regulator